MISVNRFTPFIPIVILSSCSFITNKKDTTDTETAMNWLIPDGLKDEIPSIDTPHFSRRKILTTLFPWDKNM